MDYWMLWTYLAGYLWFWRYHVGYLYDQVYCPDAVDLVLCLVGGSLTAIMWPVTAPIRAVYVAGIKYGPEDFDASTLFPGPKEVETRAERQERKAREAQEQINAARREINQHERENGLEPTRWKD